MNTLTNKQNNKNILIKTNQNMKSTINNLTDASNKILSKLDQNQLQPILKLELSKRDYIPKIEEATFVIKYNYNLPQLKQIAKTYKIKLTGTKQQLINRIYTYLTLSHLIVKVQKYFRGMLYRKYIKLHGPAYKKRELCVNTIDFLSMEELTNIEIDQFVSYIDKDGFIYGYDIISLYNLITKTKDKQNIKNPFNNQIITKDIIKNIDTLIRLGKVLKFKINLEIDDISNSITNTKNIELQTLSIFQHIDSLGNYSDANWFINLNNTQLIRFIRELMDIWNYRAPLTSLVKAEICPPLGNPFLRLPNIYRFHLMELDELRKQILDVIEKLVTSAHNRDNQCLGAYYVLGALTIVSTDAATSMPWLYQAVCYV
jgi:hypothetical protein